MKKLSIILALVMALSCFGLTAFAEETSTETATVVETTTAAPAKVVVTVNWETLDGSVIDPVVLNYELAAGGTLTADDILKAVKARLNDDGTDLIDTEEYVLSETVVAYDSNNPSGYKFESIKVESGVEYVYDVCAVEINDVENLAQVIASEAAGLDWGGIAKYNVTLINQIISGLKAAVDSLVNADWPECDKEEDTTVEEATTVETVETPDTGASAVAGAAVVVLALSAATAVVLRKKED